MEMTTIQTIIERIQNKVKEEEFREKNAKTEVDFTRNRKMKIEDVVFFVLSCIKTTLSFEIINFCNQSGIKTLSSAAVTKARSKLKSEAFRQLLEEENNAIQKGKKYKGYELIAIDGMKGELPRTVELMEKYKPQDDAYYPQFHAIAMYDILNNCFLDGLFLPAPTNEREAAKDLISTLKETQNQILLLDRGFPSVALIQQMNEVGKKFVMRVSSSFLKEVNDFSKTKSTDKNIRIYYDKRRGQTSGIKNANLPYEFDLRCVKIQLKGGHTEVLITNLSKENFKRTDIGELYNMRWGIETSFNHLKNAVHVEEFIGKSENAIKQEFFAALIVYNLCMCFVYDTKAVSNIKKNSKIKL